MPKIFLPDDDKVLDVEKGTYLLDVLDETDYSIEFSCCLGSCTTCAMKVCNGMENLNPKTDEEENLLFGEEEDIRLACQCQVLGDVEIKAAELD